LGISPNARNNAQSGKEIFTLDKSRATITKGNSPYEGWGTALKPANEPICLARKPLSEKTIVDNVIEWETGGMNIDECRVGLLDGENTGRNNKDGDNGWKNSSGGKNGNKLREDEGLELLGRWPANVILDEIAGELLDEQGGERKVGKGKRSGGFQEGYIDGEVKNRVENEGYNDSGGASRFFYSAKVSKKERNMGLDKFEDKETKGSIGLNNVGLTPTKDNNRINKNNHPTIKPVSLMTYLCRLITPKGGVVLDPFMGSGSTGISALLEGFRFIGMEMDEEYFKIAEGRINNYEEYREFIKK